MADELGSRSPAESISIPVARPVPSRPLVRWTRVKAEASTRSVKAEVRRRRPRIAGEMW
jgi:hypothetical protein